MADARKNTTKCGEPKPTSNLQEVSSAQNN